jgi:hypothetical protein
VTRFWYTLKNLHLIGYFNLISIGIAMVSIENSFKYVEKLCPLPCQIFQNGNRNKLTPLTSHFVGAPSFLVNCIILIILVPYMVIVLLPQS